MRKWMSLLLLFVAAAGDGRPAELERRFEREFSGELETVVIRAPRGLIEISNAPAGGALKLVVDLRVHDRDSKDRTILDRLTPDLLAPLKRNAEAAFRDLAPRFKADTKRVEMIVRDSRPVVFDSDLALQMIIAIRAEVPEGVKLQVKSVSAGVIVEDYRGTPEVSGESGSYFVKSVDGDFVASTTSGSITVGEVTGKVRLRTASGNILTGKLRGPAKLSSANGTIEVQQAYDALKIDAADADIVLGVSHPLPKSIDVETSAGTITLNVDRDLPLTVDAATRLLGKVRTRGLEPEIRRGSFNQSSMLADFNGGGEPVRLRTTGGNILLVGREPLDG